MTEPDASRPVRRPGPGTRFGHYEIVSALGAGGMGEVYRARDTRLGREVAVKVIAFDAATRPDRVRRFEQEARAAGALNHPNVISVFDVDTEVGTPYVVFELLEGESLRARLARDPVPLRKAVEWSVQIARGLSAAHERGIVHRDLKPENVFLTRDERLKILDFGLAKLVTADEKKEAGDRTTSEVTDPGRVLGTVGYMSPEQVRGLGADVPSDIFALGAILYELVSRRRAFRGDTAADTLTAILKEDPPTLASPQGAVPLALDRIVRRCLEKDPAQRFRTAHDLAFALEALSGSEPPFAGWGVAAPARRRRTRMALAAGVLAAVGGAVFYAGWMTAERPLPSFHRLTFRRGAVVSARYAPAERTVVYAASWDGDPMLRLFSTRVESPESMALDLPEAGLLGISRSGELALALQQPFAPPMGTRRHSRGWTGTLARVPFAGGTPRSVLDGVSEADWIDADGFAVVRGAAGARARLEFPVGKPVFEDLGIWNPRVSPDGVRVAFAHGQGQFGTGASVAVIDRTGKKTELSAGWKWATGLAWAPGGNEVWFTASKGGAWTQDLHAVTLGGRQRLLMRLPAWTVVQDIATDGRVLLTLGTMRVRSSCLAPGWSRERDVSWLESSLIEDLSADGRRLLFSEHGASAGPQGALYLTNTEGTAAPIRLGKASLGASLAPDARWAAVRSPQEIVLLPVGAGEPRKVDIAGVTPISVPWFPDSRRCLVVGRDTGHQWRIYILDVEGGRLQPLALEGHICGWPSPDGREVLCMDAETRRWIVYSLERNESRPAVGLQADEKVIVWATDGAAYVCSRAAAPEIYRVDLRTGRRVLWRRIVVNDPAGLLSGGFGFGDVFVAPQAGAHCHTTWWNLLDLYQVTGLQ